MIFAKLALALILAAPAPAISGTASWYPARGMIAAAGPALRVGNWRGTYVNVEYNGETITVQLADWCACPKRLIDLSDDAFAKLAPLGKGLLRVTIDRASEPATLPSTDTLPPQGQPRWMRLAE